MIFQHLIALASALGAVTSQHVFEPLQAKDFANIDVMKTMLLNVWHTPAGPLGKVQWSQCPDDLGVFTFDPSMTSYTPDPLTKNSEINLNIGGTVSKSISVETLAMHVQFNGVNLYNTVNRVGKTHDSYVQDSVKYFIPSIAPSGTYDIKLIAHAKSSSKKLYCVNARLEL